MFTGSRKESYEERSLGNGATQSAVPVATAMGGKSTIAALVWSRLGDIDNFVEPFANSAAVLLARPSEPRVETCNDLNPYISNFWRATQQAPDAVVEYCDWPVNETDLHSRHRWLVLSPQAKDFRERMKADPDYYDARVAGWWVWGACCWIGGEWCRYTDGPNRRPNLKGQGVNGAAHQRCRPRIAAPDSSAGAGVHGEPSEGCGVCGTPPESRPGIGVGQWFGNGINNGVGGGTCAERRAWLLDWFGRLRDRLRNVRVCCGHWKRVCDSESVTTRLGTTGIFLDPPYPIVQMREALTAKKGKKSRSGGLYQGDDAAALLDLRDEVLAYCVERGNLPGYRIAVCCYEGDGYEALKPLGWGCVHWQSQGGYANRSKNNENRRRERIYFSPGCVRQPTLLDGLDVGE
jgi:hypothetical protein